MTTTNLPTRAPWTVDAVEGAGPWTLDLATYEESGATYHLGLARTVEGYVLVVANLGRCALLRHGSSVSAAELARQFQLPEPWAPIAAARWLSRQAVDLCVVEPPEVRPIPGYEGFYADSDGTIWTNKSHRGPGPLRKCKTWLDSRGYPYLAVGTGRHQRERRLVHRLVLLTFVGPRPPGMEGCHYPDPDKTNNRVSNLRWDTHAENMRDMSRDRPIPASKVCARCRLEKPASEFYVDARGRGDGLRNNCKPCHCAITSAARNSALRRRREQEKRAERSAHQIFSGGSYV